MGENQNGGVQIGYWSASGFGVGFLRYKVLKRKGRLEICRHELKQDGSRPGILRTGETAAVLKVEGTINWDSEQLGGKRLVR